jgi:hypothetical protein
MTMVLVVLHVRIVQQLRDIGGDAHVHVLTCRQDKIDRVDAGWCGNTKGENPSWKK